MKQPKHQILVRFISLNYFSVDERFNLLVDFSGSFIENDPILSQMPNVALAFHILNEMYDSNSFWSPYLNTLPSSYDTVMYYTPKEIELLKGSPAFGIIIII